MCILYKTEFNRENELKREKNQIDKLVNHCDWSRSLINLPRIYVLYSSWWKRTSIQNKNIKRSNFNCKTITFWKFSKQWQNRSICIFTAKYSILIRKIYNKMIYLENYNYNIYIYNLWEIYQFKIFFCLSSLFCFPFSIDFKTTFIIFKYILNYFFCHFFSLILIYHLFSQFTINVSLMYQIDIMIKYERNEKISNYWK